ncbi:unnamed protein product [Polarella glacialis]|nr:unnamed protein product [Polarella glacialis]
MDVKLPNSAKSEAGDGRSSWPVQNVGIGASGQMLSCRGDELPEEEGSNTEGGTPGLATPQAVDDKPMRGRLRVGSGAPGCNMSNNDASSPSLAKPGSRSGAPEWPELLRGKGLPTALESGSGRGRPKRATPNTNRSAPK